MPVLSASECITPAFRHTIQQMFKPFRFVFWLRIAVLGLLTGELGSGGGVNGNFPSNWGGKPSSGGAHSPFPGAPAWFTPAHILELALAIAIFVIVFTLIFTYINSILRFILFDAVLYGDARIIAGWRKRRPQGRSYFVWQILLAIVSWILILVCVGLPLLLLFTSHHIGFWHIDAFAIVVLILAASVVFVLSMAVLILMVLAKDFVVPMMALEGIGWQEGWRRLRVLGRGRVGDYVIYLLLKLVLRIAAGIAHGIVVFLFAIILIVPAVIALIGGVAVAAGATLVIKALLITFGIVAGLLLVGVIVAFSAFVGAPIAVFFPSYAIYFFAGRYGPLGNIVFPPPPPPPVQAPPTIPEPPPMPA